MMRIFWIGLLGATLFGLTRCKTPPRQPPPDYGQVQQDHDESQRDLGKEEDRKQGDEDDS